MNNALLSSDKNYWETPCYLSQQEQTPANLHKMPGIKTVSGDYTEITRTQYNAIKLVMKGKQGKTRTSRELKHNNVWLDRRIRAIDENKYYITEDGE